ncbi:cystathionine gamma-lyase [Tremella mesenterica]|uniref:cystathionine gamma-lyase n=1 Tax=Tremella mesenterica TaxID=5217 RepID=A0A4Q1BQ68_TREME|nr:uncharacterized protein TREMEDRAFT_69682 [Tremella mesenterica DSM 1558]EIW67699.1 hypothetical protein TREMEDRAFT_69682 [Tremella mesenterica DSM 1558]RXK40065.1 cystathionine gamma-lyase [Tremella mesenterica]
MATLNGGLSTNGLKAHHDHFTTRAIHVGSEPDPVTGAVVPSLGVATTFKQDGVNKHRGYEYARSANPTRTQLEALVTSLETSPYFASGEDSHVDVSGAASFVFGSGSAATAAMCVWAGLQANEGGGGGKDGVNGGGGHVLAVNDVYGGSARYLARTSKSTGLEVTFLDMEKAGEEGIRKALRPDTRLIWLEAPTNPQLLVPPLPTIAKIVDALPIETRPLVIVDTTFLSAFYFTPLIPSGPGVLPLGDVTLSSLTKYGSGHSDIIMGSLTVSQHTARTRPNVLKGLQFLQNSLGATASPRDCHLMIRSLKTLSVRMIRHGTNALRIAAWLRDQPEIEQVRYPGLTTDGAFHMVEALLSPNARRELEFFGWKFPFEPSTDTSNSIDSLAGIRTLGIPFGGMVSFKLKGASAAQIDTFVTSLRLITLAESLGGVESLIEVPAGMTHKELGEETRLALGITDNLVRFSVGIEDVEDLIQDLRIGFAAIRQ